VLANSKHLLMLIWLNVLLFVFINFVEPLVSSKTSGSQTYCGVTTTGVNYAVHHCTP